MNLGASRISEGSFYMIKVAVDVIKNLKKSEEFVTALDTAEQVVPIDYRFVVHIQGFLTIPKSATTDLQKIVFSYAEEIGKNS